MSRCCRDPLLLLKAAVEEGIGPGGALHVEDDEGVGFGDAVHRADF